MYKIDGREPYSLFEQIFITAVSGYSTEDAMNFGLMVQKRKVKKIGKMFARQNDVLIDFF